MIQPPFQKYNSIPNLHNYIFEFKQRFDYKGKNEKDENIYENTEPYPTLTFQSKVKLHGSNTCILRVAGDTNNYFQKRTTGINIKDDLDGFVRIMSQFNLDDLFSQFDYKESCYVYGEWCGKGIQKGVALNKLDSKIFVIFTVVVDGKIVETNYTCPENLIYNTNQVPTINLTIDFNKPEDSEDEINRVVDECEKECPFVKTVFGLSGIGEGYVWYLDGKPAFKTKGAKHQIVVKDNKTSTITQIPNYKEAVDFVRTVVNQNRLEQSKAMTGKAFTKENIKFHIDWMTTDIIKEEMNTIIQNQLDVPTVSSLIGRATAQLVIQNVSII